ncbi:hypothetical protein V2G26_013225 [Clonostachys chloroleuca]
MFSTLLQSAVSYFWLLPLTGIAYFGLSALLPGKKHAKFPLVGAWDALIPTFIHNIIFTLSAASLLKRGHEKFPDSTFQLISNNEAIVILPHALLKELAGLPVTVASPQRALERDLLGHYTGVSLLVESQLHHSIMQRRLTPRIPLLIPRMERTVAQAFEKHFPNDDDWTEIQPSKILGPILAKVAAEALVGPEFSHDPTWVDISTHYTETVFATAAALRILPTWMQGAVAPLLPTLRAVRRYLAQAKRLLSSRISDLIRRNDDLDDMNDSTDENNMLAWLAGQAKGKDRDPNAIAQALVLLSLASVHTTLLRVVGVLYDVTAAGHDLRHELLDEIYMAGMADGGWGPDAYGRLRKMDSVMRESQRLSPPSVIGMKRVFVRAHTFADGTHVPAGAYACMAIHAIENDESHTPDADRFDGLRSFRTWEEEREKQMAGKSKASAINSSSGNPFLFETPTPTSLNFGYGRTACPGRSFASHAIKMVLVKLFGDYEFQFLPGSGRPPNVMAHEFMFTSPEQKILVRRSRKALCPF